MLASVVIKLHKGYKKMNQDQQPQPYPQPPPKPGFDPDLHPLHPQNQAAAKARALTYDSKAKVYRDEDGCHIRDEFGQPM